MRQPLAANLASIAMKTYLVGGAVRDDLLGRSAHERDWVVVGATDAQMQEHNFRRKDDAFPVYIHPKTGDEYALARRERKVASGHRGFDLDFGPDVTLKEDLARRDLTINAIARSAEGCLIDPFGGESDIHARRLRHVTEAFVEDPLRALRLARFTAELAAYGFIIDTATEQLAIAMCEREEFAQLSGPRVWRETSRALRSDHPRAFFDSLQRWNAVSRVLPELAVDEQVVETEAIAACAVSTAEADKAHARLALLFAARHQHAGSTAKHIRSEAHTLTQRFGLTKGARALLEAATRALPCHRGNGEQLHDWFAAQDAFRNPSRMQLVTDILLARRLVTERQSAQLRQAIAALCRIRVAPPITAKRMREARIHWLEHHIQWT